MVDEDPYHALAVWSAQESSEPISSPCSNDTRPGLFECVDSHRYTSHPVHDFFGKVCDDVVLEHVLQGTCRATLLFSQFRPLNPHYIRPFMYLGYIFSQFCLGNARMIASSIIDGAESVE